MGPRRVGRMRRTSPAPLEIHPRARCWDSNPAHSANRINFNRFTDDDSSEGRSREWGLASGTCVSPALVTHLTLAFAIPGAIPVPRRCPFQSLSVIFRPLRWGDATVSEIRMKM